MLLSLAPGVIEKVILSQFMGTTKFQTYPEIYNVQNFFQNHLNLKLGLFSPGGKHFNPFG